MATLQVNEVLKGTIEFGTGSTGCQVEGRAASFKAGTDVHLVAHVSRGVSLGEEVTVRVKQDGQDVAIPTRSDVAVAANDCLFLTLPGGTLTPAHYQLEYVARDETIAAGAFDIAP